MSTISTITTYLPKDDQDLPDCYGVEIEFLGQRDSLKLEVASHAYINVVREEIFEFENGKKVFKGWRTVGTDPVPSIELYTIENEYFVIPRSSIKFMRFDKRWDKIVKINNKLEKEKKEKK